jgi:hypothetical protein
MPLIPPRTRFARVRETLKVFSISQELMVESAIGSQYYLLLTSE